MSDAKFHFLVAGNIYFTAKNDPNGTVFSRMLNGLVTSDTEVIDTKFIAQAQQILQIRFYSSFQSKENPLNITDVVILNVINGGKQTTEDFEKFMVEARKASAEESEKPKIDPEKPLDEPVKAKKTHTAKTKKSK